MIERDVEHERSCRAPAPLSRSRSSKLRNDEHFRGYPAGGCTNASTEPENRHVRSPRLHELGRFSAAHPVRYHHRLGVHVSRPSFFISPTIQSIADSSAGEPLSRLPKVSAM